MIPQDKTKSQVLESETLTDVMGRPIVIQPHFIEGILPQGVTILAGAPKARKSFLAMEWALCIASNIPFAGKYPVLSTQILYLCLDTDANEIHDRIDSVFNYAGWNSDRIHFVYECSPDNLNGIVGFLQSHPDVKLLVIDTIAWIRSNHSKGGNAYLDDYHFMAKFKRLYSGMGVSSLLIHHTRKAESTNFMDDVSGSRGMTGGAHTVLTLIKSGDISTLRGSGNKLKDDYVLKFQLMNGYKPMTEFTTIREKILSVISEEPQHYKIIAQRLEQNPGSIATILSRMVKDGLIQRAGIGIFVKC